MTIIVGRQGFEPGEFRDEIARLEALAADLRSILDGRRPTKECLDQSPFLDSFRLAAVPRLALVGKVHGHPLRGTRAIVTSELKVYAQDLGWARTQSRFYRLGRPVGVGDQS